MILVVVGRFTKYAHFIPVKHPYTTKSIAALVFDNVVKLHGLPQSVLSDRDKIFTCCLWTELFSMVGTKLLISSAYHPQNNGQTERVNQCLKMYLMCVVFDEPKNGKSCLA